MGAAEGAHERWPISQEITEMDRSGRRVELAVDTGFLFGEETGEAFERTRIGTGRAANEEIEITCLAEGRLTRGE